MLSTGRFSRSLGGPRSNQGSGDFAAPYFVQGATATSSSSNPPNAPSGAPSSSTAADVYTTGAPRSTSPTGSSYSLGTGGISVEQRLRIVKRSRGDSGASVGGGGGSRPPAVEPPSEQFPSFDTRHSMMSSEDKVLVEALLGDVINCMLFPDAPPPSTSAPPSSST